MLIVVRPYAVLRRTRRRDGAERGVAVSAKWGRRLNPADGVGSVQPGHPHIRPTRKVAWCITVPTGTDKIETQVQSQACSGCATHRALHVVLFAD